MNKEGWDKRDEACVYVENTVVARITIEYSSLFFAENHISETLDMGTQSLAEVAAKDLNKEEA